MSKLPIPPAVVIIQANMLGLCVTLMTTSPGRTLLPAPFTATKAHEVEPAD
jgi:hypothetical protein